MSSIFFLLLCVSLVSCRPLDRQQSMLDRHNEWIASHGRVYRDAIEKQIRFEIFKENVNRIERFNAGIDRGYKLRVNQFTDLTNEEFRATRTGYKGTFSSVLSKSKPNSGSFRYANVTAVATTMDWREKGAVTGIKDQRTCGCCWAFSAVAAMEGITQLKTGKIVSLSEQELVDCDVNGGDEGCEGGLMDTAFNFIVRNKGLSSESSYPYTGDEGLCSARKSAIPAATIAGHEDVPVNSEADLLRAVAHQPVSVGIEGSGFDFQFYSDGVFAGNCGTNLDHAVTAVGYGTTAGGTKYWVLKNSWGSGWGEKGYMRIKRDVEEREGLCGLAMKASYPVA